MKIQYGIAGFLIGIMSGLLVGVIEMKIMMGMHYDTAIPFVIGLTVIGCAVTGVAVGVRRIKRN